MKVVQNIPPPQPKPFVPIVITIESTEELRNVVIDLGKGTLAFDLYQQLLKILHQYK